MNTLDIQRLLAAAGYYSGDLDNDHGPKMETAISALLGNRSSELPKRWASWGKRRRAVAAGQLVLKYAGFDEVGGIDGFVGPSTEYALGLWDYVKIHGRRPAADWRPDDIEQGSEAAEELDLSQWPRQNALTKFYGTPGGPQCTRGKVNLPFKMKIAWNRRQTISRFSCHEKVADSAERVYGKIASAYSPEAISRLGFDLFGGCYNFRKKRGGSTLSTHAYGVAIDTDPERNRLKWGRDRANLALPECEEFWKCWESEGWISLGRLRNFDWMHTQAARL